MGGASAAVALVGLGPGAVRATAVAGGRKREALVGLSQLGLGRVRHRVVAWDKRPGLTDADWARGRGWGVEGGSGRGVLHSVVADGFSYVRRSDTPRFVLEEATRQDTVASNQVSHHCDHLGWAGCQDGGDHAVENQLEVRGLPGPSAGEPTVDAIQPNDETGWRAEYLGCNVAGLSLVTLGHLALEIVADVLLREAADGLQVTCSRKIRGK